MPSLLESKALYLTRKLSLWASPGADSHPLPCLPGLLGYEQNREGCSAVPAVPLGSECVPPLQSGAGDTCFAVSNDRSRGFLGAPSRRDSGMKQQRGDGDLQVNGLEVRVLTFTVLLIRLVRCACRCRVFACRNKEVC